MADAFLIIPEVQDSSGETLKQVDAIARRAAFRGIVDATKTLRTASVRGIRERKAIAAKYLRDKALTLKMPDPGANPIVGTMRVNSDPIPVYDYKHTQTKAGINAQINVGGRSLIRHAFEATMASGHTGVFMREGYAVVPTKGRYAGKRTKDGKAYVRQPIVELYSSRVIDVFRDAGFIEDVQAEAQAKFIDTYQRNMRNEVDQLRAVTR